MIQATSNYFIPLVSPLSEWQATFNLTLFGQVTTVSTKSWTLPRRSSIFNHIFSPPQKASKSTLFVARTLSSQSAVIAHVRDCPSLKGTMLNGTVCRLNLFSKGLSFSLFYYHLSVFQKGAFPFPLSLFPTICCRCIKYFVFNNLYKQLMRYYYCSILCLV